MLKRKPANEYHQMLPFYLGKHELKKNNFDFEPTRELSMREDYKMLLK